MDNSSTEEAALNGFQGLPVPCNWEVQNLLLFLLRDNLIATTHLHPAPGPARVRKSLWSAAAEGTWPLCRCRPQCCAEEMTRCWCVFPAGFLPRRAGQRVQPLGHLARRLPKLPDPFLSA